MFTITSSQVRPVTYHSTSSIQLPTGYSYLPLETEVNKESSTSSWVKIFSVDNLLYNKLYNLVFYFTNISIPINDAVNRINNSLSLFNLMSTINIEAVYNETDGENVFYISGNSLESSLKYLLQRYYLLLHFNFDFDYFRAALFTKSMTISLQSYSSNKVNIKYILCKK